MEARIRKAVEEALPGTACTVERPADPAHGDYATNAALIVAKQLGKNPREVAEDLARTLREALGDSVSNVEVAGPGFVNLTLSPGAITFLTAEAVAKGESWGRSATSEGKKVMVEYTDPNPFKEMHIGHLMSNAIGEAVARLIENSGATIARANYQGDVGPHVAKALWGLRAEGVTDPTSAAELGKAYARGAKAYEDNPQVKEEIDALNKEIYQATGGALMDLWRKGSDVSLAAFEELYRRLGAHFYYYFFESETATPGSEVVRDGLAKGIFEESEGAVIYKGEKRGLHTLVFITSKQTPTYEAKEIGLAFLKEQRWPSDRSVVLTANEQIGHFNVVLAALSEIAPLIAAKTTHIAHGFLRLSSGKMSSREGNVITAAELLTSIIQKASEKNPDPLIAEQVAIGAIKYMILRQAPGSDIIFDPEKSLSLHGDSGPYLQYALVRAKKILAYGEGVGGGEEPAEPYAVERLLIHFPAVVARAERELAPNLLTTYLTEVAGAWEAVFWGGQKFWSPPQTF